jgi:ribosome-associated heat shock protein Hsp15
LAEGRPVPGARQRLDKWLFFSRAVKSRTLAQKLIEAGFVRVNSERVVATDRQVGPGDVLTMTLNRRLLVWRVLEAGTRRGPAPEAASLYEDLTPEVPKA